MQAIKNDCTESALYLMQEVDEIELAKYDHRDPLTAACKRGNLPIVKAMLDHLRPVEFHNRVNLHTHNLVAAAFFGHMHLHLLQYLFDRLAVRYSDIMRASAMTGDISMTRFLHEQGVRPDPYGLDDLRTDSNQPRDTSTLCIDLRRLRGLHSAGDDRPGRPGLGSIL